MFYLSNDLLELFFVMQCQLRQVQTLFYELGVFCIGKIGSTFPPRFGSSFPPSSSRDSFNPEARERIVAVQCRRMQCAVKRLPYFGISLISQDMVEPGYKEGYHPTSTPRSCSFPTSKSFLPLRSVIIHSLLGQHTEQSE